MGPTYCDGLLSRMLVREGHLGSWVQQNISLQSRPMATSISRADTSPGHLEGWYLQPTPPSSSSLA